MGMTSRKYVKKLFSLFTAFALRIPSGGIHLPSDRSSALVAAANLTSPTESLPAFAASANSSLFLIRKALTPKSIHVAAK